MAGGLVPPIDTLQRLEVGPAENADVDRERLAGLRVRGRGWPAGWRNSKDSTLGSRSSSLATAEASTELVSASSTRSNRIVHNGELKAMGSLFSAGGHGFRSAWTTRLSFDAGSPAAVGRQPRGDRGEDLGTASAPIIRSSQQTAESVKRLCGNSPELRRRIRIIHFERGIEAVAGDCQRGGDIVRFRVAVEKGGHTALVDIDPRGAGPVVELAVNHRSGRSDRHRQLVGALGSPAVAARIEADRLRPAAIHRARRARRCWEGGGCLRGPRFYEAGAAAVDKVAPVRRRSG